MSGKSRHVVLSVHFVVLKMHRARGLLFTSHNNFMEMFVFRIFKGNTNCHITESQGQKKKNVAYMNIKYPIYFK